MALKGGAIFCDAVVRLAEASTNVEEEVDSCSEAELMRSRLAGWEC